MAEITSIRTLSEEELCTYRKNVVEKYAEDLNKLSSMDLNEARQMAQAEVDRLMPKDTSTKDHSMEIMINDLSEEVGFLWYGRRNISSMDVSFIYDLIVYDNHRRAGYGKKIIARLEEITKQQALDKIILNVFADNVPAVKLYEKMGFKALGQEDGQIAMIKYL